MKLYGLKNCDSCRKAMKSLPHAEFVDVRADGVPADQLAAAYSALGDAGSGGGGPGRRDERCCRMCAVFDVKSVLVSSAITANKFLRVNTRRGLPVDKMA